MNVYLENVLRGFIGNENYVELNDTMRSTPEFILVDVDKDDMPEIIISFENSQKGYVGVLKRKQGIWRVEEVRLDSEDENSGIKELIIGTSSSRLTPDSAGEIVSFETLFDGPESNFVSIIDNKIYYGSIKLASEGNRQRVPEVIEFSQGDVLGKGTLDRVYLLGRRTTGAASGLVEEMKIVVESGLTGRATEVPLNSTSGYYPRIVIEDFTGDRKSEVLVTIYTGRVGEYIHAYIYTFENDKPKLIFDSSVYNEQSTGSVEYLDNYKVRVTTTSPPKVYMLDVSEKKDEYLTKIYDENGKLLRPAFGEVLGLVSINPIDYDKNGVYSIDAIQRIIGDNVLDTLGLLDSFLVWDRAAGEFGPLNQYVSIYGEEIDMNKMDSK